MNGSWFQPWGWVYRPVSIAGWLALALGACGGDGGGDDEITVGVSWNNYNEERWAKFDEPAIKGNFNSREICTMRCAFHQL